MYDCIIIGAGPIGNYLGKQLALAGLKILILEEHPEIGVPVNCTGVIGKHAFDAFGLPEKGILTSIKNVQYISPSFNSVKIGKNDPWAYVVDRRIMDSELAGHARECGVEIRLNSKVIHVEEKKDSVSVSIEKGEVITAKSCVLATGSMSALPYNLGFQKPWYFLKGAQIESEIKISDLSTVDIYIGEKLCGGDFIWIVPVSENKARVGICSRFNAKNYLESFLNKPFIKTRLLSGYSITQGIIPIGGIEEKGKRYSRIFTVGDSAGHVKPTTAGGIALGLKTADILKQSIINICSLKNIEGISIKYYKSIRRTIGLELLLGDFFRKLFLKLKDPDWDAIVELANDPKLLGLIKNKSDFDKHSKLILWALSNKQYRKIFLKNFNWRMLGYLKDIFALWV